jgi:hypothetical protein
MVAAVPTAPRLPPSSRLSELVDGWLFQLGATKPAANTLAAYRRDLEGVPQSWPTRKFVDGDLLDWIQVFYNETRRTAAQVRRAGRTMRSFMLTTPVSADCQNTGRGPGGEVSWRPNGVPLAERSLLPFPRLFLEGRKHMSDMDPSGEQDPDKLKDVVEDVEIEEVPEDKPVQEGFVEE